MRVLVVGASGVIGSRLVPQLIERGHEVIGSARSPEKAERLRGLGAESFVLDALDARAVREAVAAAQPDAIVHQATALTGLSDLKHFDRSFAQTNRLRTEGTDNLLAAARETGVRRFVAQSFASYVRYAREGGPVKSEDDPLDVKPVAAMRETMAAADYLDKAVADAGGIELRYGTFYGEPDDVPAWLAGLIAGEAPVMMGTEARGASNAKAKRELGWTLRYPSWRQGFAALYAGPTAATSAPRSVPVPAERVGSSSP
jgi:nucleoside-diphosphate-sugar epimerase